ncbi:hypothetical protein Lal_00006447 [Lupinus albus]|uniref:Uncharacterized protein n=1 Tax=Lupinus albus TaxID=3870 RepID=A0A6A4Q9N1_LUPAL|nr:hypothetical protein Lalb_Chr07g0182451 [Lupinus albus]KAF1875817.1 hypothetical protein Lal_00006447 [Lupinus albus]
MSSKVKSKNDKSLCEISMEVVANVIRLSTFSIAHRTIRGATTTGKNEKDHDMEPLVPHQFPAACKRSQEPLSHANPTFMIKPARDSGPTTTQVIHKERVIPKERVHQVIPEKEESIDGLASEYIHKIRNKLRCGL